MTLFKNLTFFFLTAAILYGGPGRLIPPSKRGEDSRPSGLDRTFISQSGAFALHYTNTGTDTVPQHYSTDTGHPDYILYAATFLERGYHLLKDTLGLPAPPVDNARNPEIDIYFHRLGAGVYGQTTAEMHMALPGRPKAYTAFSEIHNTLSGPSFYTEGIEALKVTCIHELFHIFQVGIGIWDLNKDMWFYETSATWIEEYAYPDVNDYFQYVERYVANWGDPLYDYIYDNVTWLIYLNTYYSGEAAKEIWLSIAGESAWPAITNYLSEKAGTDGWARHLAAWGMEHLYATYVPARSLFEDGHLYPALTFPGGSFKSYTVIDSFTVLTYAEPYSSSFFKIQDITTSTVKLRILSPGNVSGKAWPEGATSMAVDLSQNFISVRGSGNPWDLLIALGTEEANTAGKPLLITLEIREGESGLVALYPNPLSNPQAIHISYNLKEDAIGGSVRIYDIRGREIKRLPLALEERLTGLHDISFACPGNIASGIYILVLKLDEKMFTSKFTILK